MHRPVRPSLPAASSLSGWICGGGRIGLRGLRRKSCRRVRFGFGLGEVLLGVYNGRGKDVNSLNRVTVYLPFKEANILVLVVGKSGQILGILSLNWASWPLNGYFRRYMTAFKEHVPESRVDVQATVCDTTKPRTRQNDDTNESATLSSK